MSRQLILAVACLMFASGCAHSPHKGDQPIAATQSSHKHKDRPSLAAVTMSYSVVRRDISYVPNGTDKQTLDLYVPADAKDAAVVVYIHGGEWAKHDKSEVAFKPRFFNENGVIFISVNYRLSGTDQHPAQVRDIAAALRWTRDHIRQFSGDPAKIFLVGHSAGCHLVALVGRDPRPLATVGMKPSDLAGVVSWSGGAFDLVEKVNSGGMYAKYIHLNFGDDPAVWRDASPINHVHDAGRLPPFLFVGAERDHTPSIEASRRMADLIRRAGGAARWINLPGVDHFYADYQLGKPDDPSGGRLLQWIAQTGKPTTRQ